MLRIVRQREERLRCIGFRNPLVWGTALVVLVVCLPICVGCYFGIYAPLLKLEWKTGTNCTVTEVLPRALGRDSQKSPGKALCLLKKTPMPIAVVSLTTALGDRLEYGVACATKRARVLSSTGEWYGCTPLPRGNGYPYQMNAGRPATWMCSHCQSDRECHTKWFPGDNRPTCKYTTDSPGLNPYVLWDQNSMWLPSEYYAMWVVGFGICCCIPVAILLWALLWSRICCLQWLFLRRKLPEVSFEQAMLWAQQSSNELEVLANLRAAKAVPPPRLPYNARQLVFDAQNALRAHAYDSTSEATDDANDSLLGARGLFSRAVQEELANLIRRLPDSVHTRIPSQAIRMVEAASPSEGV